jgi:hypothetical protein
MMPKKDFMNSDDDAVVNGYQQAESASRPTLREVDAAVFGGDPVPVPESGRQTARPYALDMISPDPTQPRREVPFTVRKRAKEDGVPEWEMWHQVAERLSGRELNLNALLRGEGEAADTETTGQPLVDGFLSLVSLAASINRDGLANAITVMARGAGFVIETGERRYQAYKLLYGALGDEKFAKIPARVVDKSDVWRQAAENGSRKPLNAVGMARQLALLIMDLNRGKEGISYTSFDGFDGDCDRAFYAQVADGNTHRIPKGTSERILQATGLKSKSDLSHYRALLDIPDDLWIQADEEDWKENRIREHILNQKNPDRLTDRQPMTANPPGIKKGQGPGTLAGKDRWLLNGEEVEHVESRLDGKTLVSTINHVDANGLRTWSETVKSDALDEITTTEPGRATSGINPAHGIDYSALPRTPYAPSKLPSDGFLRQPPTPAANVLTKGQFRRNAAGEIFEVRSVLNGMCSIVKINPTTGNPISHTLSWNAVAVSQMPLVTGPQVDKDDFSPSPDVDFNATSARESIMGPDEEDDESDRALDNPLSTKPNLPAWAVKGASIEHTSGNRGVIASVDWDQDYRSWYAIVDGESGETTHLIADLTPTNATPAIDEQGPPDWATRGKTILYKPDNALCIVEGTAWDELESQWYVRVKSGDGEWADLLASECIPAIEEAAPIPYTPHPALKNREGVITEEQRQLAHIATLAGAMGMKDDEATLRIIPVMVPNHILTWINTEGLQTTEARLIGYYNTGEKVLLQALELLRAQTEEALVVARAIYDDQQRKKGA